MKTRYHFIAILTPFVAGVIVSICLLTIASLAAEDAQMEQQYKENLNSVYRELNL